MSRPESPPPHVRLLEMATAHWQTHIVCCAAELRITDHLREGPLSAADLASRVEADPDPLFRLLRALELFEIVRRTDDGRFANTPMGDALCDGAPGEAHAVVRTLGGPLIQGAFSELLHAVRTGETGFEKAFGEPFFGRLARDQDAVDLFSRTMVGVHGEEPAAVAAFDFSGVERLVDVGGATGHMLCTILAAHPGPRGVLFDLEHVVAAAPEAIAERGLSDRVEVVGGSFFDAVPAGADAYLLSHVIHDWPEEQCVQILRNCRAALGPGGRVLLVECVLPDGPEPHPGKLLDIMMLVGPGGRERTADEYAALLAKAGLRMTRVVPTASAVSVVEAVAAGEAGPSDGATSP